MSVYWLAAQGPEEHELTEREKEELAQAAANYAALRVQAVARGNRARAAAAAARAEAAEAEAKAMAGYKESMAVAAAEEAAERVQLKMHR